MLVSCEVEPDGQNTGALGDACPWHHWHVFELVACRTDEKVPAGQFMQADADEAAD